MENFRLGGRVWEPPLVKHRMFKPINEKALNIARSYKKNKKEFDENKKINELSPRDRPINILKRDIYALSCLVNNPKNENLILKVVAERVHERDAAWDYYHRPRGGSAIDWTLRLVRGRLDPVPKTLGVKKQKVLFNAAMLTRLSCELNFAFRHRIRTDYVTMFIDECGGYTTINAKEKAGGYSLLDQPWISQLQDPAIVSESENDGYGGRSTQIPKGVKSTRDSKESDDWDDDDEEWEGPNDHKGPGGPAQEGEIIIEKSENDDWEDDWEDE